MPSSHHTYITDVVEIVRKRQPRRILDIGVGFGKWGHLFREYTDIIQGRIKKEDWISVIDGIEIFSDYITEHQREIYSNIFIENAVGALPQRNQYDFIFMSDVLEHIEKGQGEILLDQIAEKSDLFSIVMVPMGRAWLGDNGAEASGNPYEAHISAWEDHDFKEWNCFGRYTCVGKQIAGWIR